jgi:hypothetical protein
MQPLTLNPRLTPYEPYEQVVDNQRNVERRISIFQRPTSSQSESSESNVRRSAFVAVHGPDARPLLQAETQHENPLPYAGCPALLYLQHPSLRLKPALGQHRS